MAQAADMQKIIHEAVSEMVAKVSLTMARTITEQIQTEFSTQMAAGGAAPAKRRGRPPRANSGEETHKPARRAATEMSRWVPDKQARRVPNFVIEMTGLKTKKDIVAKYGEDAVFEKGRPVPARGGSGRAE